jgi:hypothetical protein
MDEHRLNLMDTSTYTLDDQVDTVLHKIAMSPTMTLSLHELYNVTVMNENAYHLDHYMIEKGLLKIAADGRSITGKGLEISNFGGWTAYQKQFKKDRGLNLHGPSTLQRKYETEISSLRKEIARHKAELEERSEKELVSAALIRNLINQNSNNKLMMLMAGIVVGLVLSSVLWHLIF